jgi:hypothetical protein
MSQVKDITSEVIRYENNEFVFAAIHWAIGIAGTLMGLVVMIASLRASQSKGIVLYVSLLTADLFFCMSVIVMGGADLYHGGYSLGPVFCAFDSVLIMTSCCASILSLVALAAERYYATVRMRFLSTSTWIGTVIFIWCFSLFFATLPLVAGTAGRTFALEPGKLVCVLSWWETDFWSLVVIFATLIVLCLTGISLVFAYATIVHSFRKTAKTVREFSSNNSSNYSDTHSSHSRSIYNSGEKDGNVFRSQKKKMLVKTASSVAERNLLYKAIGFSGSFLFFWSPYVVLIVICLIQKAPVSSEFDQFCSILALTNSAFSPVILYTLDKRIKNNVNNLLFRKTNFNYE